MNRMGYELDILESPAQTRKKAKGGVLVLLDFFGLLPRLVPMPAMV